MTSLKTHTFFHLSIRPSLQDKLTRGAITKYKSLSIGVGLDDLFQDAIAREVIFILCQVLPPIIPTETLDKAASHRRPLKPRRLGLLC
jgi:hypothetical protein